MSFQQFEIQEIDQTVMLWLDELRTQTITAMNQQLDVDVKSDASDLVTNVDRNNERIIVEKIRSFDADAVIVSEEGYGDRPTNMAGHVWFVDPIDGTMNFVKQREDFAIMIALYVDGEPILGWILDVMGNVVYHGGPQIGVYSNQLRMTNPVDTQLENGIILLSGKRLLYNMFGYDTIAKHALGYRVIGAAGPSFIRVIRGQSVGYSSKMMPWDFAAGNVLAKTLDLLVTNLDGSPLDMLKSNVVLVATHQTHRKIMTLRKS